MEMAVNMVGAGRNPAPYHIRRVRTKLASGRYKTEPVRCFCGSDRYTPIAEKDRYGIEHRMVLCLDCAVIYANPRMTEESYAAFYRDEYRNIYDDQSDREAWQEAGEARGQSIRRGMEYLGIAPKNMLDVGCNAGALVKPFLDAGVECVGIDVDVRQVELGRSHGLPAYVGTLSDIQETFDFICLNHVFEHFLDLRKDLSQIARILNPDGVVYIGVPGLYNTEGYPTQTIFQNAHTYQFIGETLGYVMSACGFEELYCDERIQSFWRYTGRFEDTRKESQVNVRYILDFLENGAHTRAPMIRTYNKFPIAERLENMRDALKSDIPDMGELIDKVSTDEQPPAVIVGGGPSADTELPRLRELVRQGAQVYVIERMGKWAIDNAIPVNYVIALDASEDVLESLSAEVPGATYLLSTQCPRNSFPLVRNRKAYIFSSLQKGIDQKKEWDASNRDDITVINGGGSVTLTSIFIALILGSRDIHVFGFDCHLDGGSYASGITGVGMQKDVIDAEIEGRKFKTTPAYLSFAQQFFVMKKMTEEKNMLNSIRVYGDSMVTAMSIEDIRG